LPQSPLQETEKQTRNGALHDPEKIDTQISKTQKLKLDAFSDTHFKTWLSTCRKKGASTVSKSWRQERSQQSTTTATITRVPNA
jgi:hypothetical protein